MEDINNKQQEEQKVELEDQFILRLPVPQAEAVRHALRDLKPKKFNKFLSLTIDHNKKEVRKGSIKVKRRRLHAKLVNLPCIVETYKTTDKVHLFKTANISQMLICQKENFYSDDGDSSELSIGKTKNRKDLYPHGITPPLKNIRKRRFRSVYRNKEDLEEVTKIEKEIRWLLRADSEAVSTRFEVCYEEPKQTTVNERTIFGEIIMDSDDNQETPQSSARRSTSELHKAAKTSTDELNEPAVCLN